MGALGFVPQPNLRSALILRLIPLTHLSYLSLHSLVF